MISHHASVSHTSMLFFRPCWNAQSIGELTAMDVVTALMVFAIELTAWESGRSRSHNFNLLRN